jgi:hypothetical protein
MFKKLARLAVPVVAALATLGLSGAPALAATATAPIPSAQWSKIPPQEWDGYFGNCTVKAGPVYDPNTTKSGNFDIIGGGTVWCQTIHTYTIKVTEYFALPGGKWYAQAGSNTYSATNYATNGIVETGRICGTGWWYTAVTVSVPGYSALTFSSNEADVSGTLGC